jgi:hypothetical protein
MRLYTNDVVLAFLLTDAISKQKMLSFLIAISSSSNKYQLMKLHRSAKMPAPHRLCK